MIDTREDFIEWFAGEPNPRMSRADATLLADLMIDKPYRDFGILDAAEAWELVNQHHFFCGHIGWIDRDGKLWSCGHAAHDRLIELMGYPDIHTVEQMGWVRVTVSHVSAIYQISPKQRRTLRQMGRLGDGFLGWEDVKPVWEGKACDPL